MSEKFSKRAAESELGPNDKFTDGTTLAQRANMRAIYEDREAYADWRIRMGLSQPPEIKPSAMMRERVASLANRLAADLRAQPRRRETWEPTPARKLSLDEMAAEYAAKPVRLSEELRRQMCPYNGEIENQEP